MSIESYGAVAGRLFLRFGSKTLMDVTRYNRLTQLYVDRYHDRTGSWAPNTLHTLTDFTIPEFQLRNALPYEYCTELSIAATATIVLMAANGLNAIYL